MAKTKYQQAGTDYAQNYLDKLLEMEDYVGRKLDHIVEQKVKKIVKPSKTSATKEGIE